MQDKASGPDPIRQSHWQAPAWAPRISASSGGCETVHAMGSGESAATVRCRGKTLQFHSDAAETTASLAPLMLVSD